MDDSANSAHGNNTISPSSIETNDMSKMENSLFTMKLPLNFLKYVMIISEKKQ